MRQDKDRSGKWMVAHHGDAILKLAGFTGFNKWKAIQSETIAPRRLPDGLLEVWSPGKQEPGLVLIEIEAYPDKDVDLQVLDDLMLIAVERRVIPEIVSLILKPKGNLTVQGAVDRTSLSGQTRAGGSWPVVRLWELDAETLLAAGDVGLIPWVPLTRTKLPPEVLLTLCRDRIATVPDPNERAGLMAVTQILAGLAFPNRQLLHLFGGLNAMIDSPIYQAAEELFQKRQAEREAEMEARFRQREAEMEARAQKLEAEAKAKTQKLEAEAEAKTQKLEAEAEAKTQKLEAEAEIKAEAKAQSMAQTIAQSIVENEVKRSAAETNVRALRNAIATILAARFGPIPDERLTGLATVTDDTRLQALLQLAATCPAQTSSLLG